MIHDLRMELEEILCEFVETDLPVVTPEDEFKPGTKVIDLERRIEDFIDTHHFK